MRTMIWNISNKLQLPCGTTSITQTVPEYIASITGRQFIETDSPPTENYCYRLVHIDTLYKKLNGKCAPEVNKIEEFIQKFKNGKDLYSPSLEHSGSAFNIAQGRTRLYVLKMSGLSHCPAAIPTRCLQAFHEVGIIK